VAVPNPLPVPVCFVLNCFQPGQVITTVPVPQETVPPVTVPSTTVPAGVTVETNSPQLVVAFQTPCLCGNYISPTFYFLPGVGAASQRLTVNWGDGTSDVTWVTATTSYSGLSHQYAGPGTYAMTMQIGSTVPSGQTVVCEVECVTA
jgi:hypothetical protein